MTEPSSHFLGDFIRHAHHIISTSILYNIYIYISVDIHSLSSLYVKHDKKKHEM
jgi:hypothetical protein